MYRYLYIIHIMLPLIKSVIYNSNFTKIAPGCDYVLRFDGCSKGNPGLAGCGAVIYLDN